MRIDGVLGLSEADVRGALDLQPGDRFGFPEWLDDRDRLRALYVERGYLTAAISASRVAAGDILTLLYTITAGPPTLVRVTGRGLDSGLIAQVETAWSESVSDDFLIEEVETLVRTALARDGFFTARVNVTVAEEDATRVLGIDVAEGRGAAGLRARVTGVEPALAAEVAGRLDATTLAVRVVEDPGGIAEEVVAFLHTQGYLRAEAMVGAVIFDDGQAVVPVRVQAGRVFRVGDVDVEGSGAVSPERVREAVAMTGGDLHDSARTAGASDRLLALYRGEGFQEAQVVARETVRDADALVDVRFEMSPGAQQILREVVVRGNDQIAADAVVRAMRLPLDEPVRPAEWLDARIRLFDTELFRRVDLTPEPISESEAGEVPVRAAVEVEEWPALRLRYGFEVAEERPVDNLEGRDLVPGVRADVIRRTLLGRAVNVGVTVQVQRREQSGRTFLRTPTMFGLPLESLLVLRRSREELTNVTLRTVVTGAGWEQRYRMSPTVSVGYSYDFERRHTVDTDPDPGQPVFDAARNVARLRANASFDTRDDPSDATRGILLTTAFEYTPEALGSDTSYARYLTQAYWFRPWQGLVFATAGRFGVLRPFTDVLRSDLFFAGGARSVRGVPENGLGELDFLDEPAGGEVLLVLN